MNDFIRGKTKNLTYFLKALKNLKSLEKNFEFNFDFEPEFSNDEV